MATTQFEKGTDPLTQRVDASFLTQGFVVIIIRNVLMCVLRTCINKLF